MSDEYPALMGLLERLTTRGVLSPLCGDGLHEGCDGRVIGVPCVCECHQEAEVCEGCGSSDVVIYDRGVACCRSCQPGG